MYNLRSILISQVMVKRSFHLSVCIYGLVVLLGAMAALMLPIETKGRILSVSIVYAVYILYYHIMNIACINNMNY